MGRCGQITKHHRWLIEGRKPSFSIRLTTMKMGVALIRVLTLLTFISDVSARAGALASASSGGLLHSAAVSSGGKQVAHEASTVPAISDLERFSADVLEGDIAKAAVELSGGKEVLQVRCFRFKVRLQSSEIAELCRPSHAFLFYLLITLVGPRACTTYVAVLVHNRPLNFAAAVCFSSEGSLAL